MTKIRETFKIEEGRNIFFTSDTHFGHYNVIRYCNRPFETKEEMDEKMIGRWNEVVGENDIVFHLGDVALDKPQLVYEILNRLNGSIYLVVGNHEKSVLKKKYNRDRFFGLYDILEIFIEDNELDSGIADIVMCHYPMLSWRGSNHGSIHLHGHIHGVGRDKMPPKSLDVGVDNHDYRPLSYNEAKTIITSEYNRSGVN